MAILLSDIEASVRAGCDHDADTQITTPQVYVWANEAYFAIRRRLGEVAPDLYTRVSPDFTLGAGVTSQDLTAAPLSLTDFSKVRIVEWKTGAYYSPLPVAPFLTADVRGEMAFRLRGTILDFFPSTFVPGQIFRVKYLTKPAAKLAAPGDAVDVPDGAERVIVEEILGRIRVRFDEDPSPHIAWRTQAWEEVRNALIKQYVSTPQSIVDLSGRY